jgi:hypothetical protein
MSSPVTPTDSEPVDERNWYEKMDAAQKAYPRGQWRKQFTREEMERCIDREMRWVIEAKKHDLPGPRRFDFIDD